MGRGGEGRAGGVRADLAGENTKGFMISVLLKHNNPSEHPV